MRESINYLSYSCLFQRYNISQPYKATMRLQSFIPFVREGAASPAEEEPSSDSSPLWQPPIPAISSAAHPPSIEIHNFAKNARRTRNTSFRLKSEPSQDKIRKINQRRGRYKRSTNNSHKKFICVARRLLLRFLSTDERLHFEVDYEPYKNSRAYYFIILAHAKLLLSSPELLQFRNGFQLLMANKIDFYRKEVNRTDNRNFINFRFDQIADIEFALKACQLFFEGKVEEAIQTIYKKEKVMVLKRTQYQQAVKVVRSIEVRLRDRRREEKEEGGQGGQGGQDKEEEVDSHEEKKDIAEMNEGQREVEEEVRVESQEINLPLIHLESSYPLYSHFYPTLFPYTYQPFQKEQYFLPFCQPYILEQQSYPQSALFPSQSVFLPQQSYNLSNLQIPTYQPTSKLLPIARTSDSPLLNFCQN